MPLTDFIIILLFACANIGTLLLLKQMRRDKQAVHIGNIQNNIDMTEVVAWLNEHVPTVDFTARFDRLEAAIAAEGQKTRKETQEIKTALRDDEKDDQRQKATARARKAKGKTAS
jgi:hypothetical protein